MSERTADEWNALLGDDIAYWMGNPFLSPEMRTDKVVWWLNKAAAEERDQ